MCLDKSHWFPKISRKPIKVYKIFNEYNGELHTPYQGYICKCGDTIKAAKSWISGLLTMYIGGEGVHAYSMCSMHALREMDIITDNEDIDAALYVCEIPPFTPYWIGNYGDIAASKMIVKKRI